MQIKKLATLLLAVAFLIGALAGCGDRQLTPEERFDQQIRAAFMARAQLNDLIRSYKAYKTLLSPEKQLAVAEKVVPVMDKADLAMDQWENVLVGGEMGYSEQERWLQAKRELTMLLFELKIIKLEE